MQAHYLNPTPEGSVLPLESNGAQRVRDIDGYRAWNVYLYAVRSTNAYDLVNGIFSQFRQGRGHGRIDELWVNGQRVALAPPKMNQVPFRRDCELSVTPGSNIN